MTNESTIIPATAQPGRPLVSVGSGTRVKWGNWPQDLEKATTIRVSHTYAVSGTLGVPSSGTNYLPPFFIPVTGKASLVAIVAKVRSGSCVVDIYLNGSTSVTSTSGLTSLSITTTGTTWSASPQIGITNSNNLAPVITSVSSADGLTLSFYFDITP